MEDIFLDIGIMIIVAAFFALLSRKLKQPLIPFYILTGLIIGPILGLVTGIEIARQFSEIGIAFLLFIVGLELNLKKLKDIGSIAIVGGTIQILFLFFAGFIVGNWMNFGTIEAIYVGLVIAFSSTMVVVKLLSDKTELDTLHGRIIIGFLLIEDFFAIIVISSLNTLSNFTLLFLLIAVGKAVILLLLAFLINKLVFKPLFEYSAKSQEMLFLFALSSCFIFSFLFKYVGQLIVFSIKFVGIPLAASTQAMLEPGFSIAIGAFVAGITLATLPYTFEIIGRIKSLRDFFATIFFVSLGMEIVPSSITLILKPLLFLIIIVMVIKPLLTIIICSVFGYTKKTSFMTAATLSQTSEFGLIIVAQGVYTLGHVSSEFFTLTVLLAIITITYTAYLVKYENKIYNKIRGFLSIFELFARKKKHLEYLPEEIENEVLLVGYDRIGYSIFHTLNKLKKNFIIVDFNPDVIKKLIKQKVHCIYGDVADEEILKRLHLSKAKMVISTTPDITTNKILIKKAKQANKSVLVFVTAYNVDDALNFYDLGADYVILPHFLGGQHVSLLLEEFSTDFSKLVLTKVRHINELKDRYSLGHEHPKHERHR